MLRRWVLSVALACALLATRGLAQTSTPPAQCGETFRIEQDRMDIYIRPGVVNCFSCALDTMGSVNWQVEENRDFVPVSLSPNAATDGNFLIIAMPENYVLPGTSGTRDIVCNQDLEARLASPILTQPSFVSATVIEGATLLIACVTRNIRDITTFQILDPNGMPVSNNTAEYRVDNVTRTAAGNYTCVVTSNRDNSTATAVSTVIVQFAPEVTATNVSSHRIILGDELRLGCSYVGVPEPQVFWFRDVTPLMNGVDGVTISRGDNDFTLVISAVERTSMGTYRCLANNTVGEDDEQYSVTILVPADPVENLMVTDFTETTVSLSWRTGGDGFTPIISIEILVTPERGDPPSTNPIILPPTNSTVITELLPFRAHEFSVAVRNLAGTSDRRNTTASTRSLRLTMPTNPRFDNVNSTSLRFTWEAPIFDPDTTDAPNFYLVNFSLLNTLNPVAVNVSATPPLEAVFNGLLKGTDYIARVVPVNVVGNGMGTNFLQQQTAVDPPSEPQNLNVAGVGATALRVTWSAPADNGGRMVSNYSVFIDSINFSKMLPNDTTTLLIRDNGLVENTPYTVLVSAANREQGFGNNATAMGTTQSIDEPQTIFDPVQSDMDMSTNSSAILRWQFPGGTVDVYIVQYILARDSRRFDSPDVINITVNGSETSVLVDNLLPGANYDFRVAVMNNRGTSSFSQVGTFATLQPDPAIITVSHDNPVPEGTTIILNCSATLRGDITYVFTKDGTDVRQLTDTMFDVNPTYLRIIMVTENSMGMYMCTATNGDGTMTMSEIFDLRIQPTETPPRGGIDQTVIIIVASVGGAALLIFVVVVVVAICCLCNMKGKGSKSSYAMKPMKSKDRSNANWIETSTQFVPATGNQAASATEGDRLAFDYSVDLQTHSSFSTLEKQKVHSTTNGSDQPPPPSYSDDATDV